MRSFSHEVEAGLAEVHDVLTPEQRAQVAERIKEYGGYR
jgi:hypothetical protein